MVRRGNNRWVLGRSCTEDDPVHLYRRSWLDVLVLDSPTNIPNLAPSNSYFFGPIKEHGDGHDVASGTSSMPTLMP